MKELLAQLPRKGYRDSVRLRLIDTCFLIDMLRHQKLHELRNSPIAMTSFNAEELVHITPHLHDDVKNEISHFLRNHPELTIIDVPAHPGDRESERTFVASVDASLLQKVRDPSDAILIAAAIATKSDVYTTDKHHLFTTTLERYVHAYGIDVHKEWKD